MKTWDDWSDFDLSFNVAKLSMPSNDNIQEFFGKVCTGAVSGHNADSYQFVYFDINNPADMWPIMLENGIGMVAENGKLIGATTSSQQYYEPYGDMIYSYDHVNPLLAAAIVFLMMNGVNPE